MRRILRSINDTLELLGIDIRTTARSLRGWPAYRRDLKELRRQQAESSESFAFGRARPCLGEDTADSGLAKGHYFHQDLLIARRIFAAKPARHVDVGSRVDGFVAHVASFREIEVLDIRPMPVEIPNVKSVQADMMVPVGEHLIDYCDSLSSLHALEHFGLGRYGDPVDYDGYLLGLANLGRIVRPGGTLYLSVPIGPQRIEFNAHRVFSVAYLIDLLAEDYRLERFSYVDDCGDLHEDVPMNQPQIDDNYGCHYGCGVFELTRL